LLAVTIACNHAAHVTLVSSIARGKRTIRLPVKAADAAAAKPVTIWIRVSRSLVRALRRGVRLSARVVLTATDASGSSTHTVAVTRLRRR
jgi:hypothetical protein